MFSKFVEQLSLQSTPEVQVDRVQQHFGEQIVDLPVHHEPVHQRNVEQVVDVHDIWLLFLGEMWNKWWILSSLMVLQVLLMLSS